MIFPLTSKELKDVLENCYSKKETCEKIAHLIKMAEIISRLNLNAKDKDNDIDNYKKNYTQNTKQFDKRRWKCRYTNCFEKYRHQ